MSCLTDSPAIPRAVDGERCPRIEYQLCSSLPLLRGLDYDCRSVMMCPPRALESRRRCQVAGPQRIYKVLDRGTPPGWPAAVFRWSRCDLLPIVVLCVPICPSCVPKVCPFLDAAAPGILGAARRARHIRELRHTRLERLSRRPGRAARRCLQTPRPSMSGFSGPKGPANERRLWSIDLPLASHVTERVN